MTGPGVTGGTGGSGGYGLTTEEMANASRRVHAINDAVQADLTALRTQLGPLQGAWRGQAATAFAALMARWDADARSLSDALRAIGDGIQGSGVTYQEREDQQAGALSAIRAALG